MDVILDSEKKLLKIHILHFIFYSVIIIFNFVLIKEIIWLTKILYYLFFSGINLYIICFLIPVIPMFFIVLKKLKKKNILKMRQLTLIFCVIAIILGLFFSIILTINIIESSDFNKECPFNIPITDIINKTQCTNRICILNYEDFENKFPYEYFCNYNAKKYFEEEEGEELYRRTINDTLNFTSDNQIICEKYEFNGYIFQNNIINNYLSICDSVEKEFYICQRFFEHKKYDIENNYKCPDDNYLKYAYIFCILNILFNLILSFVPWKIELNIYDKVINQFRVNNNRISNSFKSTKNSSKIMGHNREENFKKEPTQLIIIFNNNNRNNNINNNIVNEDNNNNIYNIRKETNIKINEEIDEENEFRNKINNPQNSADIFIIDNNRKIKKNKNRK